MKDDRMNLGHRIFVVQEDAIFPISQKAFNQFYFRNIAALPNFAGQTVQIALVFYTLEKRKPKKIVRIDCERIKILANGSVDEKHQNEGMHLAVRRIWPSEPQQQSSGAIVDATARFEERKWNHRHPQLSGASHKRILDALFK